MAEKPGPGPGPGPGRGLGRIPGERTLERTNRLANILTSTAPGNLNRALRRVPSANLLANIKERKYNESDNVEEVWEVNTSNWVIPKEGAVLTRNEKKRNKTLANFSNPAVAVLPPAAAPAPAFAPATKPFLAAAVAQAAQPVPVLRRPLSTLQQGAPSVKGNNRKNITQGNKRKNRKSKRRSRKYRR